jgi:hypothetical protein
MLPDISKIKGEKTVAEILPSIPQYLPSLAENAKQYLGIDV